MFPVNFGNKLPIWRQELLAWLLCLGSYCFRLSASSSSCHGNTFCFTEYFARKMFHWHRMCWCKMFRDWSVPQGINYGRLCMLLCALAITLSESCFIVIWRNILYAIIPILEIVKFGLKSHLLATVIQKLELPWSILMLRCVIENIFPSWFG